MFILQNKGKPTIENIKISKEEMEALKSGLAKLASDKYRSRLIRDTVGGVCLYCYMVCQ
jgi:hypothetical protein